MVCTANGTYGDLAIPKNEIKSDSMPLITHDPDEGEILWIKNSLVELINEGVNYQDIRKSSVSGGVQFLGFQFMGASQASISFSTYDSMMEAFEMNLTTWSVYFDELRPSIDSDGPIDRYAWIEVIDFPLLGWSATTVTKILASSGRIIGFDKVNLECSSLGYINSLIGTRHHRFIKETILIRLNGADYRINL